MPSDWPRASHSVERDRGQLSLTQWRSVCVIQIIEATKSTNVIKSHQLLTRHELWAQGPASLTYCYGPEDGCPTATRSAAYSFLLSGGHGCKYRIVYGSECDKLLIGIKCLLASSKKQCHACLVEIDRASYPVLSPT